MPGDINFSQLINCFPTANLVPQLTGDLRTYAADFKVEEMLAFKPCGEGEHLFLQVRKIDSNTDWVARQLLKKSGLTSKEIGYAGKKDRHSVSIQWFSLHLPGKQIELSQLAGEEYEIIRAVRHNKKLRRGSLLENSFKIVIRNLSNKIDPELINQIRRFGVPNYFGPQRFGFDGNNLIKANELLNGRIKIKNRNKRGIMISSARSFLFNLQLAQRIRQNSWLTVLQGDCLILDGSQSFFQANQSNSAEQTRIDQGDLHISGWLAGKQATDTKNEVALSELNSISEYQDWLIGLARLNLDSARRAFRCIPKNLTVTYQDNSVELSFSLSKGCFATSVIREMVTVTDQSIAKIG